MSSETERLNAKKTDLQSLLITGKELGGSELVIYCRLCGEIAGECGCDASKIGSDLKLEQQASGGMFLSRKWRRVLNVVPPWEDSPLEEGYVSRENSLPSLFIEELSLAIKSQG
jgi:hypothetical protein